MIIRLFLLVILSLFLGIAAGFLGFLHPGFDTFSNLRAHFSITLLIVSTAWMLIIRAKSGLLLVAFALAGLFFSIWIPRQYHYPTNQNSSTNPTYSFLHLNLFYENETPEKAIELITRINADIVALSEISEGWKIRLAPVSKAYPFNYYCPEWRDIGGSVIYSRFHMISNNSYCHNYAALALKDVVIENKTITIGAVHIRWPWPASGPRQLEEMRPTLNQIGNSALIVGDFNSTTWTWLLHRFSQYGDLQIMNGIGPTWIHQIFPANFAKYVGFPIDNAMVKGDIVIKDARALQPAGSDHLPVLIRFGILN